MKRLAALALLAFLGAGSVALAQNAPDSAVEIKDGFVRKVVVTGLQAPWELSVGPDGLLWVTERTAGQVTRIDPATKVKTVLVKFKDALTFSGQDGTLGMTFDPMIGKGMGHDFVYVAYTYDDKALPPDPEILDPASPHRTLRMKVVRLTWDATANALVDQKDILTGLPAGNDHDSGRLKFGPDGMLYLTLGDGGRNQFANTCMEIEAQRLPTADEIAAGNYLAYRGKSIRLTVDGTIPADNPELGGVRSHVYTYGHRNMQGIDFGPDGTLYASEQGPKTDDEVNILTAGGNYGWPHVAGFRDDMGYQYANWSAAPDCDPTAFSDLAVPASVPQEKESAWSGDFVPPVATLFTVPSDWNFADPICNGMNFICWPTVAAASIEYYGKRDSGMKDWGNSLLVPALKRGSVYRVPLSADGKSLAGPIERLFHTQNRYRDTAISPDGRTIYVITDSGGLTEKLGGGATDLLFNPGAVLAFTARD